MHAGEQDIKPDYTQPQPDYTQLSSNFLGFSFQNTRDPTGFKPDPSKLLPQLLDQLTALGQTARQLRQVLGGDGHRPEQIAEVIKQLTEGGDHAH